jgi:hypothetical protein
MESILHLTAPGFSLDVRGEWWEERRFNRIATAAFKTFAERGFSFHENVLPGLIARPKLELK